ncbi:hypothetical protein AC028_08530 [Xanthomonas citri pv. aurantifolii]|uniref:hypothetical protein n=2 Tax=Xanthomonas citri TaxID=346 RepID=UPI000301B447|nr:hypothetical protein [Xanthomonas citri]AMV06845.1 hypothetical protein AC028_08530 [Xanthomonas citri pv. aurantifolii]ARE54979.1 hypothetical protein TP45_00395 [Xanthomonas citri pv. aurantifolii]MCT8370693.1 hypothetical protein [Xanthomonas citri pv. anacardii]
MMVCKRTIIVAAAGLSVCNAAWADHVDMRIVRDYPAGTPAVAHIHAWLQQQSRLGTQPRQAPPPAAAAALGAVRISTASFDRPLNTRVDNISNAAPLPARGQPRDDITIDACNTGRRYRWVYSWEQSGQSAAWQLRSYRLQTVADCQAPPEASMAIDTAAEHDIGVTDRP